MERIAESSFRDMTGSQDSWAIKVKAKEEKAQEGWAQGAKETETQGPAHLLRACFLLGELWHKTNPNRPVICFYHFNIVKDLLFLENGTKRQEKAFH